MSEVKTFRIKGRIVRHNYNTDFSKDLLSTSEEGALEKICADLGSQHKVKRVHIKISSIEEIKPEESSNMLIKQLYED
jgi:large subunit ribosomal protein LX